MDSLVTPPKRVTSPTWGPPPPRKQPLSTFLNVTGQTMRVYRVATKGQEEGKGNWVTSYYLAFSSDGQSFTNYTQGQNRAKVGAILVYCAGKKKGL